MNGNFASFIDGEPTRLPKLPLLHTTDGHSFRDILHSGQLTPTYCDVWDDNLLYLFYGRPSYRVDSGPEAARLLACLPVCFILDENVVTSCKRLLPFDSGAYSGELFSGEIYKKMRKEDFELSPEIPAAQRLVSKFYDSNGDYVYSRPKSDVPVPALEFEAEAYRELVQSRGLKPYDDRCSALEVQCDNPIDLQASAVLAVVGPEPLMNEPVVREAIENRWGAESLAYDFTRMKSIEYTSVIFALAARFFEDRGYL